MAASTKLKLGSGLWKEKKLWEIIIIEQETSKISQMESIGILEKSTMCNLPQWLSTSRILWPLWPGKLIAGLCLILWNGLPPKLGGRGTMLGTSQSWHHKPTQGGMKMPQSWYPTLRALGCWTQNQLLIPRRREIVGVIRN